MVLSQFSDVSSISTKFMATACFNRRTRMLKISKMLLKTRIYTGKYYTIFINLKKSNKEFLVYVS